mgnify:FL=1
MGSKLAIAKIAIASFLKYYKAWCTITGENPIIWKHVGNPVRTIQRDSWNCGVFIMHIMRHLDKGTSTNEIFNPDEIRAAIKKGLLESSDDMYDDCLYCNKPNIDHFYVQCKDCQRWVHGVCTHLNLSPEQWAVEQFQCELCLHHLQL